MRATSTPGKQILWLVVSIILLLTGVSAVLSVRHARQSEERITREAVAATVSDAAAVDEYLVQRISVLQGLATAPVFFEGSPAEQDDYMKRVDLTQTGFSSGMGLVDLNGVMTAFPTAKTPDATLDVSQRAYIQELLRTSQPVVGAAVVAMPRGNAALPIGVPVRDRGGALTGFLIGALRLDAAGDPPLLRILPPNAVLVDQDGQVIVEHGAVTELRSLVGNETYAALAGSASGARTDGTDFRDNGDRLLTYATTSVAGWLVVVDQPRDDAFGAARRQLLQELAIKGLFALLALVGAWLAVRRMDRATAAERRSGAISGAQSAVLEQIARRQPLPVVLATMRREFGTIFPSAGMRRQLEALEARGRRAGEDALQPQPGDLGSRAADAGEREALRVSSHLVEIAVEQERSLRAREESERQLRRLVDTNVLGVFTAELGGRLLEANELFLSMLGYTREQLEAGEIDLLEITPEAWRFESERALATLATDGRIPAYEKEYRTRDGEHVAVLVGKAVIREGVFIGYALDLSELKRAQAEMASSERRYRALVDATSQFVWRVVPGQTLTEASTWWETMTGQPVAEQEGFGWLEAVHPDDRERVGRTWRGAFAKSSNFASDYRVRSVSGGYRHLRVRGVALPDPSGDAVEWIGTFVDVSEETERALALEISEERQRLALAAADLGAWDWDLMTGAVSWSPVIERHLGLEPGAFPGTIEAMRTFVHPDDREMVTERGRDAIWNGTAYNAEFRMIRTDGSIRWSTTSGHVVRDELGRPVRLLGIDVDTTEERERRNERQIFLASVAHDLKNPIAVLTASAQILRRKVTREGVLDPEEAQTRLAVIEANASRLSRRLDDLSDLALLEAGSAVELTVGTADLVQIASGCLKAARRVTMAHTLRLETSDDTVLGRWDASRIERVVDNLISNAVKYSPNGGEVNVRIWTDAGSAYLSVEDQGIGVPDDERATVFQFRRRGSNVGDIGGSGVGLAGAARLVELTGGDITVAANDGGGSVFVVRLPMEPANGRVAVLDGAH